MSIELKRVGWENGTLVSPAKVLVDGQYIDVIPEQYSGNTPLSAENLKAMEDNTENAINSLGETATTLLNWTGVDSTDTTEYTLNDDMTKYKFLYILFSGSSGDEAGSTAVSFVTTSLFKNLHNTKALSTIYDMGDSGYYARVRYKTDTSVNVWASAQLSPAFVKIIGLN